MHGSPATHRRAGQVLNQVIAADRILLPTTNIHPSASPDPPNPPAAGGVEQEWKRVKSNDARGKSDSEKEKL